MSNNAAACTAIEQDLSALIDEELAPEREAELRAHLETCDRCARRLQELCNVDLVLASLPAPEVASDLRAQLAGRIAEHERLAALSARRPRRPRRAWRGPAFARFRLAARPLRGLAPPPRTRRWLGRRLAVLAALAAAALLAIFATLRSGETPAPDAPQIARPATQAPAEQGPEPGAEERGEPILAEQPSLQPEPAPRAQPEAARIEIAEKPAAASQAAPLGNGELPPAPGLEGLSEEDLAMLLVLDEVEDLDVIANLELLEDLLELERMEGAG